MKTLHDTFIKFNEVITLTQSKMDSLRTSRDALQDTIIKWFKEKHPDNMPSFKAQGSFTMKTALNQLDGEEYDIDLGVYISGFEDKSISEYPNPQLFHTWINEATKDETEANNINKNTCVRVTYKKGYHVDLPPYIKNKFGQIYLAHVRDGWVLSDPIEFTNWFNSAVQQHGDQLRRVVKYMKAWKDYRKLPLASIAISILVVNNFEPSNSHDELALYNTVKNINCSLHTVFSCRKPVQPYEDVFEDYSDTRRTAVLEGFESFVEKMSTIIGSSDCETKKKNLRKLFGDRFPIVCDEDFEKTDKPGVLKSDGRSA